MFFKFWQILSIIDLFLTFKLLKFSYFPNLILRLPLFTEQMKQTFSLLFKTRLLGRVHQSQISPEKSRRYANFTPLHNYAKHLCKKKKGEMEQESLKIYNLKCKYKAAYLFRQNSKMFSNHQLLKN